MAGFLGQEEVVNVGQNAAVGDGDGAEQPAELLVVPDGQLDVARHYPSLLVVPSCVPGQLQNLNSPPYQPIKYMRP